MKSIQEIYESVVSEAVEVNTTYFEFSHGKKPSGYGAWMFSKYKDIDFNKHKEGKDYISVPSKKYSDAKKDGIKWARDNNISLIYVPS